MAEASLTQAEIDQLLKGADDFSSIKPAESSASQGNSETQFAMSPMEKEQVLDTIQSALAVGAKSIESILARRVRFQAQLAEVKNQDDLAKESTGHVLFTQNVTGGLSGSICMCLPTKDAFRLSSVFMGQDQVAENVANLDTAQIATIRDSFQPLLYSTLNYLSVRIENPVTPLTLDVRQATPGISPVSGESHYLKLTYSFKVEGSIDTRFHFVLPVSMSRIILQKSRSAQRRSSDSSPGQSHSSYENQAQVQIVQTDIKDVQFPQLSLGGPGPASPNEDLLMDVQMTITVELGRTKMHVKDILGLGEGSIIELDKLAGEPVDLLVNGKLIAKGEVVVIDENFGVRITDIVSPIDRLKKSQAKAS